MFPRWCITSSAGFQTGTSLTSRRTAARWRTQTTMMMRTTSFDQNRMIKHTRHHRLLEKRTNKLTSCLPPPPGIAAAGVSDNGRAQVQLVSGQSVSIRFENLTPLPAGSEANEIGGESASGGGERGAAAGGAVQRNPKHQSTFALRSRCMCQLHVHRQTC